MAAEPLTLDEIERLGAVRFGHAVKRIVIVHEDDRQVSIDLPRSYSAPLNEEQGREAKIIAFFADLPDGKRIKGRSIAEEIGEEDFYDSVRKTLSSLVKREILHAEQGSHGYARGAKYPRK